MSTVGFGPNQDTLIALYQKAHLQLLGYGIYIQMLMILGIVPGPPCVEEKYFHQI
jgi:hypothetical protein